MPPYWKNYYRRRYQTRRFRRPRYRRWGIRKTFRRRRWRRNLYRKRYKVKRLKFLKRKTLKLKQWQPKSIKKCKIVGYKCLLQGNVLRAQHNYAQYIYSYVPTEQPGGGGWSLMVFSLGSLFEDYDHLLNIWTNSNAGLPLCRYTGCTIKLFQSENTDYAFTYDTCWPMVDTPYTHADSSPSRIITKRHKVIMPSKQTKQRRKPYKKIKIKPPHQMINKWYFQKDICNQPLLMTTTTAISLTKPFATTNSLSNNITFKCLNTFLFNNPHFQHFPEATGYSHKILGSFSMYLYATTDHNPPTSTGMTQWLKKLIFLGNTTENTPGQEIQNWYQTQSNTKKNWGNPFFHRYLETGETSYTIYSSKQTIVNIVNQLKSNNVNIPETDFQVITGPIFYTVTYNPSRDTGLNKIYLIETAKSLTLDEPENKNLVFEGFPLYDLIWGWTDFIKKLKIITNLDQNSLLVIVTKIFDDQTLKTYIPIDLDFIEGRDPYQTHDEQQQNYYNSQNWFPKLQFQEQTINTIALTNPFSPRPNTYEYLQCFAKYTFYFKWGGCPKQLEKAYDPCLQSTWTTPDNLEHRVEIKNPNTDPQTELYYWDWDSDFVNQEAIKRIQQYTTIDETLLSSTDSKWCPKALKQQEKETSQKEEEKMFLQLHNLRKQRLHLELKCRLKLMELKSAKAK